QVFIFGRYDRGLGAIRGVFMGNVNVKDFTVSDLVPTLFPQEFQQRFYDEGYSWDKIKKFETIFYNLKTCFREDGSFDVIVEPSHSTPYGDYNSERLGSIFVAHFANGKPFYTYIPTNSYAPNDYYTAYFQVPFKDKLVLLYNDTRDNENADNQKPPKENKWDAGTVLMSATIDAT